MSKLLTIILLLLPLTALAFLFQGSRGIWQPDEGYYTGTAVTMLERHKLLIPYLGEGEIFLDKPPAIYWAIIAGIKLFGHNEFAARFFHGVSFIFTAILTGLIGWELFRDKLTTLLAVFIYSTMIVPYIAANFITPDTLLTLWTTLVVFFFWKSVKPNGKRALWRMLLCLSVGFGFLTKGPAVLIPCCGLLIFLAVQKQLTEYFWTPWSIIGLGLFIIVGLGWYIWASVKIPGALSYFLDSQIWGRLISEKYNRNPGIGGALIYVPVLVFGSLPWSLIWIEKRALISRTLFSGKSLKTLTEKSTILFLLCWFFIPLLILCLASSKLGLYALPVFPALAIATARLWREKIPSIGYTSGELKMLIRPATLCGIWVILLILSKLALVYYPTANNMKTLWAALSVRLPETGYEIATVDKRADGLLFYGAKEVEHLTTKSAPYPTFTKTETILEEAEEMIQEEDVGFLLVHGSDRVSEVCDALQKAHIEYRIIVLPYQRTLLALKLENNGTKRIR